MRRTFISRSLASVLALWLAVCLAEPVQLHTCAMHGGLAIQQTTDPTHDHYAAAEHLETTAGAGHSHHDQSSDSQSRQCSCLGDCSAGRSPVGIAVAGVSLLTISTVESSASDFEYASPRLVSPPFLLPFSNGPPTGSSRA